MNKRDELLCLILSRPEMLQELLEIALCLAGYLLPPATDEK